MFILNSINDLFLSNLLLRAAALVWHFLQSFCSMVLGFNSLKSNMSSSREDSPDWLRSFQAPTVTLSSDSDSLPDDSPSRDDKSNSQSLEPDNNHDIDLGDGGAESPSNKISKARASGRGKTADEIAPKKMKTKKKDKIRGDESDGQVSEEATSEKHVEAANHSVWTLSSDSESFPDNSSKRELKNSQLKRSRKDKVAVGGISEGSLSKKALKKEKSPKKLLKDGDYVLKKENGKNDDLQETGDHVDFEVADDDTTEKHTSSNGTSSRIPLLLSEKVNRSKALVECDGESIDLSGDVGAVGRVVIPNASSGNHEMFFDLKGTIFRTTIIPSKTFCVVSFGPSEAKIEAIMNDFIQLKAHSNVYEAETMVEGTLEGFSFDSEDEAEKMPKAGPHQTDQNEGKEEKSNGKTKRKAEKSSGKAQKKGRSGGKPQPAKKATKKAKSKK
ncbi:DNA-binding protein BIN4-like isoform X3 [Euphorbia lathyris]|uniref:DNA-binding protein BIN4-like isoform X3 n=1 Tax=Euphorbia lathyris TaxID=212925 RepID=UPI003313E160